MLFEKLRRILDQFTVHTGQNIFHVFEYGDLGTETFPYAAELEPNDACADHDKMFRDFRVSQSFGAGADAVAVEFHAREWGRDTTGGDKDVLALKDGFVFAFDNDFARPIDATFTIIMRDAVFL